MMNTCTGRCPKGSVGGKWRVVRYLAQHLARSAGGGRPMILLLMTGMPAAMSSGCFLAASPGPVEVPAAPEPVSPLEEAPEPVAVEPEVTEPAPAPATRGDREAAPDSDSAPVADAVPEPPADHVTGSPAALHPELADHLDDWFEYWVQEYGPQMRLSLERMGRYGDIVDTALEERGMPRSLRYLPIVESYYNPRAYSRVGAAGMWQFMPATARERGLMVNSLVDERRDPVAATEAALDMLAELHERFDSWFLALAAYNGGPNRLARVVRERASGTTLSDATFLEIREHLPGETRHFIPKFLAAAAIADNPGAYDIDDIVLEPVLAYDEVTVPDATSLDVVAMAADVPEEEIRALNPHLPLRIVPAHIETVLRLPPGTAPRFESNYAAIPTEARMTIVEHTISAGETLGHIAQTYGVRLSELISTNPGLRPRYLQIGQKVVVPRLQRVLARN